MTQANPIICAIDTPDPQAARALAANLRGVVGGIKLGLEFFIANGPAAVREVAALSRFHEFFLDLKLHDIPNTVASAVRSTALLHPTMLTIHCAGGAAMMRAAVEARDALRRSEQRRLNLLGVTVLTSLDDDDLAATGQRGPAAEQALRLALLARASGLDGVICSPHEAAALRTACGPSFLLVVPGIRPAGIGASDQRRVMSAQEARAAGADHLVIGRPITQAADPAAAARAILSELR